MAARAGQGRRFDLKTALDAAMLVFWNHGYEGASLAELTKAMGINPPSLYKAFGSKEQLFFQVVEHYNATHGSFMARAFAEEQNGNALLKRLLNEAADHYPSQEFPGGCLVISSAVTVTEANKHVSDKLAAMRNSNIRAMAERDDISLEMARFTGATLQGMSQQARDGASAQDLHQIAEMAVAAINAKAAAP